MTGNNITWTVTESERWTVLNALRIAKDVVTSHAKDMSDVADALRDGQSYPMFAPGEAGVRAAEALAAQHRANAEEFDRLYEQVESAPRICVMADESDED